MSQKEKLLNYLEDSYTQFRESFADLSETQMADTVIEADDWNVCDILAHITGWNQVASESLERMARGESPKPSGVDYSNSKIWNEYFVAEMRGESPDEMVDNFDASFAELRQSVESMPEGWFEERRMRVGLLLIEADHYLEHANQIRQWRQEL